MDIAMKTFNKALYGTLAAMAFTSLMAEGVPARPGFRTMTGTDGTIVNLQLVGDEHFSYYTTTDGLPVVEDSNGRLTYARISDGRLEPSGIVAHNPEMRCAEEIEYISRIDILPIKEMAKVNRARRIKNADAPKRVGGFPSKGKVKGLIILAEFSDVKFSSPTAAFDFNRAMNEQGYADYGATGSARDYFIDQSMGKFTPDFDVIGPVSLPQSMAFYGENDALLGKDHNISEMVYDACRAAAPQVDFSEYDFDNDDEVDLVFIIYAGYNEAQGGGSSTIWPQQWDIKNDGKNLRLNGKRIGRYACTSELRGYEGTIPDGIGTFCHEFSHCLGLPDIYDTEYSGLVGMGAWDLMDAGSYNNDSRTPAGYSAYEREAVGWMEIPVLNDPKADISLRHILTNEEAYKIVSPYNPNEYFTLENRQQEGWDSALPGHGLVITHIDYDEEVWRQNLVNSSRSGHSHLQIVPAGGQLAIMNTAAYPGPAENHEFSHHSLPLSSLWSGETLEAPVTNIQEKDGVVTFNFRTYIDAPFDLKAVDTADNSVMLSWTGIDNADRYEVEVSSINDGVLAGKPINEPTLLAAGESILSPSFSFADHHTFTLQVTTKGNRSAIGGLKVRLISSDGKVIESKSITLRDYERTDYWVFSSSSEAHLEFEASDDMELISALVYNGNQENVLRAGEVPKVSEYNFYGVYSSSETSLLIDNLHSGREYVCRVKGFNEEFKSESNPSAKICFSTTGDPNPNDVSAVEGIEMECNPFTEIYNLNGYLLYSSGVTETESLNLQPGIYLIKANGKVSKRIVK